MVSWAMAWTRTRGTPLLAALGLLGAAGCAVGDVEETTLGPSLVSGNGTTDGEDGEGTDTDGEEGPGETGESNDGTGSDTDPGDASGETSEGPPCGGLTCDFNATCEGDACVCGPGYEGDGETCTDIDGCAGDPCFAGAECMDEPAPGEGRANGYVANGNGTLVEFEQYLGNATGCSLDFYVFSAAAPGGALTQLWRNTVPGAGTGFQSSGPMNIPIVNGTYYALGVGWNCTLTYYWNNSGAYSGFDAGVGLFNNSRWDNSYPGPSDFYAPPNTGGGTTTYRQRIYYAE